MDELGVKLMSWGPLAEASSELLNNETLLTIGAAHGKTVAQVAMRYLLQRGIIIIPKSTRKERMEQNFQLFDFTLTESEMQEIDVVGAEQTQALIQATLRGVTLEVGYPDLVHDEDFITA